MGEGTEHRRPGRGSVTEVGRDGGYRTRSAGFGKRPAAAPSPRPVSQTAASGDGGWWQRGAKTGTRGGQREPLAQRWGQGRRKLSGARTAAPAHVRLEQRRKNQLGTALVTPLPESCSPRAVQGPAEHCSAAPEEAPLLGCSTSPAPASGAGPPKQGIFREGEGPRELDLILETPGRAQVHPPPPHQPD